jgi:hypothetical protein
MAKIVGKNATITYEVLTSDEETEKLLQQTIFTIVTPIINQDREHWEKIIGVSAPASPKKKGSTGLAREDFGKQNIEAPELIPLGGEWAYSVGFVTDAGGEKSVRIAKGKIRGGFYRDKRTNEMVLTSDDPMNPISLVNHINIKRLSEWENLQVPVMKRLKGLDSSK